MTATTSFLRDQTVSQSPQISLVTEMGEKSELGAYRATRGKTGLEWNWDLKPIHDHSRVCTLNSRHTLRNTPSSWQNWWMGHCKVLESSQAWAKHTINERLLQKPSQLTQITLRVFCEGYRDTGALDKPSEMRCSIAKTRSTCHESTSTADCLSQRGCRSSTGRGTHRFCGGRGWERVGSTKDTAQDTTAPRNQSVHPAGQDGTFLHPWLSREHLSKCPKSSSLEFQKLHLAFGPWQREINCKTRALKCVDWIKLDFLFILLHFNFSCAKSGNTSKSCVFFTEWPIMLGICICMDVKPLAGTENCATGSNEDAQYKKHIQVNWVQEPTPSCWSKKRNQNCICHHLYQEQVMPHKPLFLHCCMAQEKVLGGKWHQLTIPNSVHKI